MADLFFKIDQNVIAEMLTGEDIETIEMWQEGEEVPSYRIKRMAAKFMVDEKGNYLPKSKALRIFNDMKAEEYSEGLRKFAGAMSEAAIPKASGTPSKPPSAAPSPDPAASPDGS